MAYTVTLWQIDKLTKYFGKSPSFKIYFPGRSKINCHLSICHKTAKRMPSIEESGQHGGFATISQKDLSRRVAHCIGVTKQSRCWSFDEAHLLSLQPLPLCAARCAIYLPIKPGPCISKVLGWKDLSRICHRFVTRKLHLALRESAPREHVLYFIHFY